MQQEYAGKNRKIAVALAKLRNIALASHDDTTVADVDEGAAAGINISEFPTTIDAAAAAKQKSMYTIMGSPNAIRGISHSGNVSAMLLAEHDLLDGLSSDYVPSSLLHSVFHLSETLAIPLHRTMALVSANPAAMVGLTDRGVIAPGKRADLLRVSLVDKIPLVRRVWREGIVVA